MNAIAALVSLLALLGWLDWIVEERRRLRVAKALTPPRPIVIPYRAGAGERQLDQEVAEYWSPNNGASDADRAAEYLRTIGFREPEPLELPRPEW